MVDRRADMNAKAPTSFNLLSVAKHQSRAPVRILSRAKRLLHSGQCTLLCTLTKD